MPQQLADNPTVFWEINLAHPALGGITATESFVVFGGRSLDDRNDLFQCFDALAGLKLWDLEYSAEGELDYGISPRTTPLIYGDYVFLFGAFGDLHCVDLISGEVQWKINVREAFAATAEMPWGYCGSPLLVDGKLIINPGAAKASLVAMNPKTGHVLWKSPGKASGYGSLIAGRFGGKMQIVGHDTDSIGGWDPQTGKRLWTLTPPNENDFNVPTPINLDGQLLVSTENNGTRLYRFNDNGKIDPKPVAQNSQLNPDTSSPVVVGDRLFCVHYALWCLDLDGGMKEIWKFRDAALSKHGVIIASNNRLLVIGDGDLLLIDPRADKPRIISRVKIFEDKIPPYSHPALVGTKLFIRNGNRLKCLDLSN